MERISIKTALLVFAKLTVVLASLIRGWTHESTAEAPAPAAASASNNVSR